MAAPSRVGGGQGASAENLRRNMALNTQGKRQEAGPSDQWVPSRGKPRMLLATIGTVQAGSILVHTYSLVLSCAGLAASQF